MKEYEYSMKVDSLKKYITFCKQNGFKLIGKTHQLRTIYRNNNKTIARITINEKNGKITKELDFKEDKLSKEKLIIRKESLPIKYTDDEAIYSILDFLEYKKDNVLNRTRYVYEIKGAKFELDEYVEPEKSFVVSLEGNSNIVDDIWKKLNNE